MRKEPNYLDKDAKLSALARMKRGENVTTLAAELGVVRRVLYRWRALYRLEGAEAFQPPGRPRAGVRAARRA